MDQRCDETGLTLTYEEFIQSANNFIRKSDKLFDGWILAEEKGVKLLKLVRPHQLYNRNSSNSDHIKVSNSTEKEDVQLEDFAQTVDQSLNIRTCPVETISVEYHVIYSVSFSVPVLYMNAYDSSGRLLELDKLLLSGRFNRPQLDLDTNDRMEISKTASANTTDKSIDTHHGLNHRHFVRPDTFSQMPHPLYFMPYYGELNLY